MLSAEGVEVDCFMRLFSVYSHSFGKWVRSFTLLPPILYQEI
jgi:hypothetical protein